MSGIDDLEELLLVKDPRAQFSAMESSQHALQASLGQLAKENTVLRTALARISRLDAETLEAHTAANIAIEVARAALGDLLKGSGRGQ